jgi:hypothetical protein
LISQKRHILEDILEDILNVNIIDFVVLS